MMVSDLTNYTSHIQITKEIDEVTIFIFICLEKGWKFHIAVRAAVYIIISLDFQPRSFIQYCYM